MNSRAFGGESSPPMVILHGMLGSSRNWQTAAQALGETYRVYCLDLRNHGESPWAEPHSFKAMVEDGVQWMDARLSERAVLVGHSMGGKVAMKLACENPKRLRKLVVVDIVPKPYPKTHDEEFAGMRAVERRRPTSRAEAEAVLEDYVAEWGMRKFLLTNLVRSNGEESLRWAVNLDAIEPRLRELEKSPLSEEQRYQSDALFVMGGQSRYFEKEDIPLIRRHFPASAIEVIPDSGHNPHFETRERFVEVVNDFVAGS